MILKFALIVSFTILEVTSATFEEDVTLTLEQKILLDEFKERVVPDITKSYMKAELYLVKWLRSSRFDLDLAVERFRQNLQWRKDQSMDTIHSEDWSDMWNDDIRYYVDGRDKLGRPYALIEMRHIDIRKLVLTGKGERYLRYLDKGVDDACQLVHEVSQRYGNVSRGNLLINLDGLNVAQHGCVRCIPYLIRALISFLDHQPECLDKTILVNAPAFIEQYFNLAVSLVPKEIMGNLLILGTNWNVWKPELLKYFDPDQLPRSLGGRKYLREWRTRKYLQ
ncbi:SEC14 cytosolic factor [Folsomia candida]|uniref:SEC14 cytosolic factor n=1 Tax=Folsomia candida TaxID=158441 RepID=A0A226DJN6_FOLCA|nr:SEC14 cytosolic factor [Folsomia candida]OXA44907.1 SEC14 cytosolic factor [Folsomia candida]